ncbi:MAG: hypothetical protein IPM29_29645 [Planctomycetes bacterium]|nr:hypothetical protein [Planctomycetota bacterium]
MISRLTVATCVLAAPLVSQVTASLQTESTVGVAANDVTQSLAPGTPQAALTDLSVSSPGTLFAGPATMAMTFRTSRPLRAGISWQGSSSYFPPMFVGGTACTVGNPGMQEHSLLWVLQGSGGGTVIVDVAGAQVTSVLSGTVYLWVDVGADGSTEYAYALGIDARRAERVALPVRIPASGALPVRIRASVCVSGASPGWTFRKSLDCDLEFVPGIHAAAISSYGSACGAALTGADRFMAGLHRIELTSSDGLPNEATAFVFGSQQVAVPIGVSGCTLHVAPLGVIFRTADATGRAVLSIDLPAPIHAATAYVQAFSLEIGTGQGNEDWEATQGLQIAFADPR